MAEQVAIFAGGCFWCTEAVFNDVVGVTKVESGYTGGSVANPTYKQVCGGDTGHAEAIRLTFDPDVVSYDDLLDIFFATHDPTQLNRQGNDVGTQYRSAIFPLDEEQERLRYLPGYAAFRGGSLVVAAADRFWAPERLKAEIPTEVKRLFRGPGNELADKLRQPGSAAVAWEKVGDRLRLAYPMQVAMQPRFVGEARLILETDAKYLDTNPQTATWRVAGVELIRGKTPSAQRAP